MSMSYSLILASIPLVSFWLAIVKSFKSHFYGTYKVLKIFPYEKSPILYVYEVIVSKLCFNVSFFPVFCFFFFSIP